MASHFENLSDAKKEFKQRTGIDFNSSKIHYSGVTIYNRNRGRKKRGEKLLKRPYFVGTYFQWVNI